MDALRRPCFMQVGIVKHITSHETHPLIAEVRSKAERYHTDFLWCRTVSPSFANRNPFLHLLCLFHFIGACTVLTVWGGCLVPFRELHGSLVLLLSLLLYPAYRGTQGQLLSFSSLYKSTPRARGNLWGFLTTACLVSPSRHHKEHFKVLGLKTLTAKKIDAK